MNIIVLIKEVPDMEVVRFDRERGVIDRSSAGTEINPFDLYALQAAVDLKEKVGGHITAITMGPKRATSSLKDAWARGADECICVTDSKFAGADTYATSKTLSAVIAKLEVDLILCGEKTVDGDTAQVGAGVAELLELPHSYYVEEITKIEDGWVTVVTSELCGLSQVRKMKLPALISVGRKLASPLLPSLKRKIDSIDLEVKKVGFDELSDAISEEEVGLKGSPTKVSKIVIPKEIRRESEVYREDIKGFCKAVKSLVNGTFSP